MKKKIDANTALTIASLAGTVLHGILVRRASEKEVIFKHEEDQSVFAYGNVPKTRKEMVKGILPFYIPSMVVGAGIVASIIFNHRINRRTIAGLSASVFALERGYRKYKDDIKSLIGGNRLHAEVIKRQTNDIKPNKDYSLLDDELLFYEEQLGYFTANLANVMEAYGYLNQRIHTVDFEGETLKSATLKAFFDDIGATSLSDVNFEEQWGWNLEYLLLAYDSAWVHMNILESTMDDGTQLMVITWEEEPIINPSYNGEYTARYIEDNESNFKKIKILNEAEEH